MFLRTPAVLSVLVMILAVFAGPTLCRAEGDHEKAAKAFETGVRFYNEGRFDLACPLFDKAYKLRPSWKLWYNIGQCQAALKNYGVALDAFENYLVSGGDELDEDRSRFVISETSRLKALVGEVSVKGPDGAEIVVDGRVRGSIPETPAVRVTARISHKIEVRRGDEILLSRSVKLGSGQKAELVVGEPEKALNNTEAAGEAAEPEKAEEALTTSEEPRESKKPVHKAVFWSGLGLTAGLGVATGIAGIVTNNKYEEADGTPSNSPVRDELSRAQTAGWVLGISAGAALVTTAVLSFFTDFGSEEDKAAGQAILLGPNQIGWSVSF